MAAPGSAANPLPSRAARPWSLGQALNVVVFGVPFRVVRGVPGAPDSRCCRRTSAATPACRTPPVHSWSSAPRILPRQPASVADAGPGAARRARLRGLVQHAEALHAAPWLVPPAAAGRGGPGIESGTKGAGLAQFRLARPARATVTTTGTRSILSVLNSDADVCSMVAVTWTSSTRAPRPRSRPLRRDLAASLGRMREHHESVPPDLPHSRSAAWMKRCSAFSEVTAAPDSRERNSGKLWPAGGPASEHSVIPDCSCRSSCAPEAAEALPADLGGNAVALGDDTPPFGRGNGSAVAARHDEAFDGRPAGQC